MGPGKRVSKLHCYRNNNQAEFHMSNCLSSAFSTLSVFNHAIARASLASSQLLQQSSPVGQSPEDPLANALEKYALAEEKVGEARLAQDQQIQSRFLAGWTTTLNTNIQFATKARRAVENARLSLDATKAAKRSQLQARGMNPDDESAMSEEARAEIEAKEDEFVTQVEEAQSVMKNASVPHPTCTETS